MTRVFKFILVLASAVFLVIYGSGVVFGAERCFIGDSFTEGLEMYGNIEGDFYGIRGIGTEGILRKNIQLTKEYDEIYLLLGINEVCDGGEEKFIENYKKIVTRIRDQQPWADIYVQSIVHTTREKSENSRFKNIYVDRYNEKLKELKGVTYVDLNKVYDNGTGALFEEWSKDGIHLKPSEYWRWKKLIIHETKNLDKTGRRLC